MADSFPVGTPAAITSGTHAAITRRKQRRWPINTQIDRLIEIASGILKYVESKKNVLDEKTKADLKGLLNRLLALKNERRDAQESVTFAKTRRAKAAKTLKKGILKVRRLLDAVVVGDDATVKRPRVTKGMFLPSRIHGVAAAHLEELGKLEADPAMVKAAAALKAQLAEFDGVFSENESEKSDKRITRMGHEAELQMIAGKLNGYRMIIAYSVPAADRQDLKKVIHDLLPTRESRKDDEAVQTVTNGGTANDNPTVIPALPSIPNVATVVPPSSEHPAISANA